jgi:hypothetical protein
MVSFKNKQPTVNAVGCKYKIAFLRLFVSVAST